MRETHELMAQCWPYALSCFSNQAQRLAREAQLPPPLARDLTAELHGFSCWSSLCEVMGRLQDVALAMYIQDQSERDPDEERYLEYMMPQLARFIALPQPIQVVALEQALLAEGTESVEVDAHAINLKIWEAYADVKLEFGHRTLWSTTLGLSRRVQAMIVDIAEKMRTGFKTHPPLASDRATASKLALHLFTSSPCSSMAPGPLCDYLDTRGNAKYRVGTLVPADGWMNANALARRIWVADADELDGSRADPVPFSLLAHAPHDTTVKLTESSGKLCGLDDEVLVPDLSFVPQAAMMGSVPIIIRTITLTEARIQLDAPDKAGWLAITFG